MTEEEKVEEEILNIEPENLTDNECMTFSSNEELKKKYEDKWNVKGVCEI